jgi:hypothetical protein
MAHFVSWNYGFPTLSIYDVKTWKICHQTTLSHNILDVFHIPDSSYLVIVTPKERIILLNLYSLSIARLKGQYSLSQLDDGTLMNCSRKLQKDTYSVSAVTISNNKILLTPYFSVNRQLEGNKHRCFVGGRNYLHCLTNRHHVYEMKPGNTTFMYNNLVYNKKWNIFTRGDALMQEHNYYSKYPFDDTYSLSPQAYVKFLGNGIYGCVEYYSSDLQVRVVDRKSNTRLYTIPTCQYVGSNDDLLVVNVNEMYHVYDIRKGIKVNEAEVSPKTYFLKGGKFITLKNYTSLQEKMFKIRQYSDVSLCMSTST